MRRLAGEFASIVCVARVLSGIILALVVVSCGHEALAGPTTDWLGWTPGSDNAIDDDVPENSLAELVRSDPALLNGTRTGHAMNGTVTVNGTTYSFGKSGSHMILTPEHPLVHVAPHTLRELVEAPNGVYLEIDKMKELQNGDVVTVTVINSSGNRNAKHWLAAYAHPNPNVTQVVPAKYAVLTDVDPTYAATGTVQVKFKLVNMRSSYVFKLFEEDWQKGLYWGHQTNRTLEHAVAVATSRPVTFANPNGAEKIRTIPVSHDPPIVRVMWSSGGHLSDTYSASSKPFIQYASANSTEWESVNSATTHYYDYSDLCDEPATSIGYIDPGLIHSALISLAPGANSERIRFQVGVSGAMSAIHEVKMPPGPGEKVTLAVYGDMGHAIEDDAVSWQSYGSPSKYVMAQLKADLDDIDVIFHTGDISYATGFGSVWEEFLNQISEIASARPYLTLIGNHEQIVKLDKFKPGQAQTLYSGHDSGGECGVPYLRNFITPRASDREPWYSIDLGLVHVIAIDTEMDTSMGSPQRRWLEADLAMVDRSHTPWILFAGHRAMYVDSKYRGSRSRKGDEHVCETLRRDLEPLLVKYRVSLATWAHTHTVQRSCAVVNGACVSRSQKKGGHTIYDKPSAPIHVVVGTGGASMSRTATYLTPYMEYVDYLYGYSKLTAHNRTHLEWQFINANNTGSDGTVADSFFIQQDADELVRCPTGRCDTDSYYTVNQDTGMYGLPPPPPPPPSTSSSESATDAPRTPQGVTNTVPDNDNVVGLVDELDAQAGNVLSEEKNDSEPTNARTTLDAGTGDIQGNEMAVSEASRASGPAEAPVLVAEETSNVLSDGVVALIVLLALASTVGIAHIVYRYFKKSKYINSEFAPLHTQEL